MSRVVLLAAVLALAGCGGNGIQHGRVVSKEHQPAHTSIMFFPIWTTVCSSGPGSSCHTQMAGMIPWQVYDDEDWILHVRDGDKSGRIFVDPGTYRRVAVGSYYAKGRSDATSDPVKKLRKEGG